MGPTLSNKVGITPDTGKLKTKEFLGIADLQPSQENKSLGFRARSLNVTGGEGCRSTPDALIWPLCAHTDTGTSTHKCTNTHVYRQIRNINANTLETLLFHSPGVTKTSAHHIKRTQASDKQKGQLAIGCRYKEQNNSECTLSSLYLLLLKLDYEEVK